MRANLPVAGRQDVHAVPRGAAPGLGMRPGRRPLLDHEPLAHVERPARERQPGPVREDAGDVVADRVALDPLARRVVVEHDVGRVHLDDRVDVLAVPGVVVAIDQLAQRVGGVGSRHTRGAYAMTSTGEGADAGRLGVEDVAQRLDRHLDLVERRLARRERLEPEARSEQRADDRVLRVLPAEPDHLVGQARDHRQEQDPRGDQHRPVRPADEREHEDRDDHHPQQERRPAADVDLGVRLDALGRQLGAVLVGVDRLVLGGVVLEHPAQVGHERDQRQVGDQEAHPDPALDDDEQRRSSGSAESP